MFALAVEPTGQDEQLPSHFLRPMGNHHCSPYHVSASKLIFLHIEHLQATNSNKLIAMSFSKPLLNIQLYSPAAIEKKQAQ